MRKGLGLGGSPEPYIPEKELADCNLRKHGEA